MNKVVKIVDKFSGEVLLDQEFDGDFQLQFTQNTDDGKIHRAGLIDNGQFGDKHWIKKLPAPADCPEAGQKVRRNQAHHAEPDPFPRKYRLDPIGEGLYLQKDLGCPDQQGQQMVGRIPGVIPI
jgi:hypothetical protein